jgi:uncharacterized integral membrane protein
MKTAIVTHMTDFNSTDTTDDSRQIPDSGTQTATNGGRTTAAKQDHQVTRTGASEVLVALSAFFIILLLIVIFILQNQASARITFLWMHGSLPLALAILLSVIFGALLVALAAGARVLQLRHTASRHRQEEGRTNAISDV